MPVIAVKPGQIIIDVASNGQLSVNQVIAGEIGQEVSTQTLFTGDSITEATQAIEDAIFNIK